MFTVVPGFRTQLYNRSEKKGKGEPTVDGACWIYEQLRYILFSFLSSQLVFVAK